MVVILRAVVGVLVISGLFFVRVFIYGRVFYLKYYEKVKQRNSYIVMFKEEGENCASYGYIECFVKVRYIYCYCNVIVSCLCSQWMYLVVINRFLLIFDYVEVSDGVVKVIMQYIVKVYFVV